MDKINPRPLGLNKTFSFYLKQKHKQKTVIKYCLVISFELKYFFLKFAINFFPKLVTIKDKNTFLNSTWLWPGMERRTQSRPIKVQ